MAEEAKDSNSGGSKFSIMGMDAWTAGWLAIIVMALISGAAKGVNQEENRNLNSDGQYCTGETIQTTNAFGEIVYEPECYYPENYNEKFGELPDDENEGFTLAGIFKSLSTNEEGENFAERFINFIGSFTFFKLFPWLMFWLYFISFVLTMIAINLLARIARINKQLEEKLTPAILEDQPEEERTKQSLSGSDNARWEEVKRLVETNSESMWRMAILEADIMLADMLKALGYSGDVGTQLKQADPNVFHSLNEAWEAHKVRNKIAHMGKEFMITQEEAKRVIDLYEVVFQEWEFI